MKKNKNATPSLKRVFGLVSRCDATHELFLSRSITPLDPVLQEIAARTPEQHIHKKFSGIKPEEIKTARAYLVRFGTDTRNPAALPSGHKALLLDENVPHTLIPWACETFGPSSHVEAEGLSRLNLSTQNAHMHRKKIDSFICDFALTNKFSGILTCDTDFIKLARIPDHPAQDIHIFLLDSRDQAVPLQERLEAHTPTIRETLKTTPARLTLLKL